MSAPEPEELLGAAAPFDAVAEAKTLLRCARAGALATVAPKTGAPFATLVNVATEPSGGDPILLLSTLAPHTRHLTEDPRLSLLLAAGGPGDPLSHPRLTLTASAQRVTDADRRAALKARFLARHLASALYADFADFSFWHVTMERAYMNGGFARAASFAAGALRADLAGADALLAAEAGALTHMNADHREALALYATVLAGQPAGDWQATGLDPDGLDLGCGDLTARIAFPTPVCDPGSLRATLVELARSARQRSGAPTDRST